MPHNTNRPKDLQTTHSPSIFLTSTYSNYQLVPYTPPTMSTKRRSIPHLFARIPLKKILYAPVILIKAIPSIISTTFLLLLLYLFLTSIYIVQKDIQHRIMERRNAIESLVKTSKYNYFLNKCEPSQRVPALQKLCSKWECEMNRSVDSVEICRIVAEVLGEFVDSFVGRIGLKTLGYALVVFIVYLYMQRR